MKTPDEIKKGLECCLGDCHNYHCEECPYMNPDTVDYDGCPDNGRKLAEDALALIRQLTEEGEAAIRRASTLMEHIQQLEAERDAAVKDMTKIVQEYGEPYCEYCKNWKWNTCPPYCRTHSEGFRWRGVQKEE